MNIVKKIGIAVIIYGIWCVWLTAITSEYINDDGWILYPMFGTIIFITIAVGVYLAIYVEGIYFCEDCKIWNHGSILIGHPSENYYENKYYCDYCYKNHKNKKRPSIDGDED
jgi:hypothetical protein